jgi:hypothetical protein
VGRVPRDGSLGCLSHPRREAAAGPAAAANSVVDVRVAVDRDPSLAQALAQPPGTVSWRAEPGDDWVIGWQATRDTVRDIHAVLARGPWDTAKQVLVSSVRGDDWVTTLAVLPSIGRAEGRTTVVWAAAVPSRSNPTACQVIRVCLGDRSAIVRENACRVAAYSQRRGLLPDLRAQFDDPDAGVRESARLAEYAIRAGNHHIAFPHTDTRLDPSDSGPRLALLDPIAAVIRDAWFAVRGERSHAERDGADAARILRAGVTPYPRGAVNDASPEVYTAEVRAAVANRARREPCLSV